MKPTSVEPWIPILFTVLLILGLGIAFGIAGQVKLATNSVGNPTPSVSPSSSPAQSTGVRFGGTLTADGCITSQLPVGDVGCSVTLDNKYVVEVEHGNTNQTQGWGTMIGFPAYPKSPVGSIVEVYAHQVNQTNFTLEGSEAFYVKVSSN